MERSGMKGVALECRVRRCFLFAYTWTGTTQQGNGNLWVCLDGFPSLVYLKAAAQKGCPEPAKIVISGWCEFANLDDYAAFIDGA